MEKQKAIDENVIEKAPVVKDVVKLDRALSSTMKDPKALVEVGSMGIVHINTNKPVIAKDEPDKGQFCWEVEKPNDDKRS